MITFNQYTLDARPGTQVAASRDSLIDILRRAPLGMTATAQHALRAAVEFLGAGRLHEFGLRLPVVSQRLGSLRDMSGGFAA